MGDPGHIPLVLEQHNVGGIVADGSVPGVLIKDVLDKVSDECFIMVMSEQGAHEVSISGLHVVLSPELHGQFLGEVLCTVKQLHITLGTASQ